MPEKKERKMNATQNYNGYTVAVATEPHYYGSNCSTENAERIARDLRSAIESEFPGITTEIYRDGNCSQCISGPDSDVCEQIEAWISENWTSVL